jgi:hypothetical protein
MDARSIIGLWPSREQLAQDISAVTGKERTVATVHRWYQRNAIPGEYDIVLLEIAKGKGIDLPFSVLRSNRVKHEFSPSRAPLSEAS